MPIDSLRVDRSKCVGFGNCVRVAPQTFRLDEEGFSTVVDPVGDSEDAIEDAIEGCPSSAIEGTTP